MFAKPQIEHHWFKPFLGEWDVESECKMGTDQPPTKSTSVLTCRTLKEMWYLFEGEGESPETGSWKTLMSLGYDTESKQYVGTFIATMMSQLWSYTGTLDESGKKLVLECEGPKFDGSGTTQYRDIIEIVTEDHWVFSSQMLCDDGTWFCFMTAHHSRKQ